LGAAAFQNKEVPVSDYFPPPEDVLPLFQMAPAQQHSRTSMAAADSLDPDTLNKLQGKVLATIQAAPAGLTDEEISARLGMNPSTQRPRRIELQKRGFIEQAGTRRTASGRQAAVWKARK
jgi:hypothetical protein